MEYYIVKVYFDEKSEVPEVMYLLDQERNIICTIKDIYDEYNEFTTYNVVLSNEIPKAVYNHQMRER